MPGSQHLFWAGSWNSAWLNEPRAGIIENARNFMLGGMDSGDGLYSRSPNMNQIHFVKAGLERLEVIRKD